MRHLISPRQLMLAITLEVIYKLSGAGLAREDISAAYVDLSVFQAQREASEDAAYALADAYAADQA